MTDRDAWVPSDERLAAIRERESKATPGPWTGDPEPFAIYIYGADGSMVADTNVPGKYGDPDDRAQPNFEDGERGGIDAVLRLRGVGASKGRPKGSLVHNYAFMIHARDDVRWLIAELTTAQSSLAAARAELRGERERCVAICETLALMRRQGAGDGPRPGDRLIQAAQSIREGDAPLWKPGSPQLAELHAMVTAEVESDCAPMTEMLAKVDALLEVARQITETLEEQSGAPPAAPAVLDRSATKPAGEG